MIDRKMLEKKVWYQTTTEDALSALSVTLDQGLTSMQAEERLQIFGTNEIIEFNGKSIWKMLWAQLTDTMVLVLLGAAAISVVISDWKDAIAILAIVLLNALIGLVQEHRAEQAMAALKQMASPRVKVRRDRKPKEIDTKYLVPGDIIILDAGGKIPAEGRLQGTGWCGARVG